MNSNQMNPMVGGMPGAAPQRQQQVRITLDKTQPTVCKCGGQVFSEGVILRKVSRILTGQPEDGVMPIPAFYCVKCHEILQDMLPNEVKNELNKGKVVT